MATTSPVPVSPTAGMFFLSSVYTHSWTNAYGAINGTNLFEMLRLLDQIDRKDLSAFIERVHAVSNVVNVRRILFAARVVVDRKVPSDVPSDVQLELAVAKDFLAKRSPLRIPRDPTGVLPSPIPGQPGLSKDDYTAGAKLLGVEPAVIHAVADVESGGRTGFAADGRPIVRYELHTFQSRTKGAYHKTHPHLSQSYEQGKSYHKGGQPNEWSMIYGAMMLQGCEEAAVASASFGMFQIMGFNYKLAGYGSAVEFASACFFSAGNHLQGFLKFCKAKGLTKHLAAKDWASFAYGYNGEAYKDNEYDTRLEEAYKRHAART